jgi:DNA-directed RNA polymerase subunit RPC12/RpoP
VALDERAFFLDKNETRPARYSCPRCNRTNEYLIRWVRRVKKDRLPPGADERDRAKFAKLRDHLIRVDDEIVCKTCGKKFEIPSLHSLLFVDQLEGLPKDVEEEDAGEQPVSPAAAGKADLTNAHHRQGPAEGAGVKPGARDRRLPRRFTTPSRGWRG